MYVEKWQRHLLQDFRNLESEFRPAVATFFSQKSYFRPGLLPFFFFLKSTFFWLPIFRRATYCFG